MADIDRNGPNDVEAKQTSFDDYDAKFQIEFFRFYHSDSAALYVLPDAVYTCTHFWTVFTTEPWPKDRARWISVLVKPALPIHRAQIS